MSPSGWPRQTKLKLKLSSTLSSPLVLAPRHHWLVVLVLEPHVNKFIQYITVYACLPGTQGFSDITTSLLISAILFLLITECHPFHFQVTMSFTNWLTLALFPT